MLTCRNCGGQAEPERQNWATVVCFKCVPPTKPKEAQPVVKAKLGGACPP